MSTSSLSSTVLRVFIVRHGETAENVAGIIQGQMDTVLNDEGLLQSRTCAEALKNIDFTIAFSSDLKRAAILAHHPNTQLHTDDQLRERNMGELQGAKVGTYDRHKLPASVETAEHFVRRALGWWKKTIERNLPSLLIQPRPVNVLVISHGAFIATLCRELLHGKMIEPAQGVGLGRGTCFNTSITVIGMRRDKHGTLERYADISHLLRPVVRTNADEEPQEDQVEVDRQL
ncbi:phosphoglycerate mutase-like protein [Fomitiporia mediterranea MF3/22]|uniref:phosphoglycerate mutase-like protein n=1 Tax=Fomitiporia mediterranea (strain MF3/22) TaxID=694068 RepID=UPI0004409418|nr:phosphoglycerate mutase-like protein [Fomitiporia mediterranea MF3/22]EJD02240.1 phosphoglycerate mutase-like protein [Fomitiporia mediterranea MF3/22]